MADCLVQWARRQPIRSFEMYNFSWQDQILRNDVVAAVLEKPTLERFSIGDVDPSNFDITLRYNRCYKWLRLKAWVGNPAVENLAIMLPLFQAVFEQDIKNLFFEGVSNVGFGALWTSLKPFLQQSYVQKMSVDIKQFTATDEILQFAEAIRDHQTLREIHVSQYLPFVGLQALLMSAPRSLRKIIIGNDLTDEYSEEQFNILQDLVHSGQLI
ncbi:unnamed protein product, partial [Aphanomyces euteiches]